MGCVVLKASGALPLFTLLPGNCMRITAGVDERLEFVIIRARRGSTARGEADEAGRMCIIDFMLHADMVRICENEGPQHNNCIR